MTEHEWLTSTDAVAMLRLAAGMRSECCGCLWLSNFDGTISMAKGAACCPRCDNASGRVYPLSTDRKLWLFAAACGRVLAKSPLNFSTQTRAEVEAALAAVEATADGADPDGHKRLCERGCYLLGTCQSAARHVALLHDEDFVPLLRCIFGNPFRGPWGYANAVERRHNPADGTTVWDEWLTPTVVGMAQTAYEERAFDRLPILADALEEAGCADAAILGHLHGPGPHARGCWALDLILGKR